MRDLKVVIADDHPVVLVGLREVIQRDERFDLRDSVHYRVSFPSVKNDSSSPVAAANS